MRDLPLTMAEAAAWLRCSEAEVQELLNAGRLRPFQPGGQDGRLSLNAVVVLAESLPTDRRIFEVREAAARPEHGHAAPGARSPYPTRPGGHDQRPAVIVERRTTRTYTP
ncbi:helix-turn-helix domain-containing protein [Azospirillum soli]|uniref:helix-turn-helix domain-containing protein n=1 Tax=Azospirillum soli TaxID=1304799 RepID=UPI001AE96919|nr:helix-turn-helix domain-containing protein [Azospirillum soli]MBP2314672.1 hypothetical protein [Azospirillum soli]